MATTTEEKDICDLVALLDFQTVVSIKKGESGPFLSRRHPWEEPTSVAYSHLVAARLAMDHFNGRNPTVVPELAELTEGCDVELGEGPMVFDAGSLDTSIGRFVFDQVLSRAKDETARPICAIVGPYTNAAAIEASVLAKGLEVPLLTHGADDTFLFRAAGPYTVGTSVNLNPLGDALVYFLRHKQRTNFLATIADSSEFGKQALQTIDSAARETGFERQLQVRINPPFTPDGSIRVALEEIRASTYRTIAVVLQRPGAAALSVLADLAEEYGMNGNDHMWIFLSPSEFGPSQFVDEAAANPNVAKLLNGAAVLRPLDGFDFRPVSGSTDPFLEQWREIAGDESYKARVDALVPAASQELIPERIPEMPHPGSSFLYDAVMLAGLGRCQERRLGTSEAPDLGETDSPNNIFGDDNDGRKRRRLQRPRRVRGSVRGDERPDNPELLPRHRRAQKLRPEAPRIQAILDLEFSGATGTVEYTEAKWPRNRQPDTITYGIYNIRDNAGTNESGRALEEPESGTVESWFYLTDFVQGSPVTGNWTETPDGPFLFADGTPTPPALLLDPPDSNYLSSGVRIFGLTLMGFSIFMSFLMLFFVFWNRKSKTIRRYQPEFLYLLLGGTTVLASSVIVMSQDESYGWDDAQLDKACMAFPWLSGLGYFTIYMSLYSKLWRLNQVLQSVRTTVTVKHVLLPFVALGLAVVVILSLWTVISPLQWERKVIDDETLETYGRCESTGDHGIIFKALLLSVLALSTIMAAVMAWKTKDVHENFSEARYIFYAIALQCQMYLVAVPILYILEDESADATYLGRMMLIAFISLSTVLIIFLPKMWFFVSDELYPQSDSFHKRSQRKRGTVGEVWVAGVSMGSSTKLRPSSGNLFQRSVVDSSFKMSLPPAVEEEGEVGRNIGDGDRSESSTEKEEGQGMTSLSKLSL